MNKNRKYIAIDLKSFYASVECVERNLDPLNTNLVVANIERTEKTICLAISPSLKSYGISGRPRLFEVISKIKDVNYLRSKKHHLIKESVFYDELNNNPNLRVSYIIARPRMALYIEYSTRIYNIYLKYIAPEDIHVYSIDEVFMDVTNYLNTYHMSAEELTMMIIKDVLKETGITATAGIGTNLYLAKVAMDIVAKHKKADKNGVRMASLDEMTYRKLLWDHKPLTDFWRVGKGYKNRLEDIGLYTMGDIARCSIDNEDLLYKIFGINAETLIDHVWGYEPCEIKDIKEYTPTSSSLSFGQVLDKAYNYDNTWLLIKEMIENISLDLVDKGLVTKQIVLTIGYDIDDVNDNYHGEISLDNYGRKVPKHAHGTANLDRYTSSNMLIKEETYKLYQRIMNKKLNARRITICVTHLEYAENVSSHKEIIEYNLFDDIEKEVKKEEALNEALNKEKKIQESMLKIKKKYGKNAILKGMNLLDEAKTITRNQQIGGHEA